MTNTFNTFNNVKLSKRLLKVFNKVNVNYVFFFLYPILLNKDYFYEFNSSIKKKINYNLDKKHIKVVTIYNL